MKCSALALLAAGAYAVQDTAPPVISLDLAAYAGAATSPATTVVDGNRHMTSSTFGATTYDHKTAHSGDAHVARSCAVGTEPCENMAAGPTCEAKDHHDTSVECDTTIELVNNNNDASPTHDQATYSEANTAIRSMWLFHYNAVDESGNKAEEVTFELTVYDHVKPTFTSHGAYFGACTTDSNCSRDGAKYVHESCSQGDSDFATSGTAPCTKSIGEAGADDNIDSSADMTAAITYSRVHHTHDWTYAAPADAAMTSWAALSPQTMNTHSLGSYFFTWKVCDTADQFGKDGTDNCHSETDVVKIVDTTIPVIDVDGVDTAGALKGVANTYECGQDVYTEQGATCKDLHDSFAAGSTTSAWTWDHTPATVDNTAVLRDGSNVVTTVTATATVTYDCTDEQDLDAVQKSRDITVVDTTDPVCTITGDLTIENSAGTALADAGENTLSGNDYENDTVDEHTFDHEAMKDGFTCTDECNDITSIAITKDAKLYYGKDCATSGTLVGTGAVSEFPEYTAGAYSVLYTCTDNASHSHTQCRVIENVDHTEPILQILGSDHMTLEATHEGNYIDDGATCSDQVDGVISQNVEVSGDVVNLSKVGSYTITYNCKDSAGNSAPTLNRQVHVKQTSCPTCDLDGTGAAGALSITHEASFPYTDATVTCTDVIDGGVDTVITVTKDGAAQDPNQVNVEVIGTYKITYRAQNSVGLWNDGKNADGTADATTACRGTDISYVRTVEVKDTLQPVIQLRDASDTVIANGAWNDVSDTTGDDTKDKGNAHTSAGGRSVDPTSKFTLMAESATTSSVNGWVIGAVASAVTGLALLGYSQRKTTVATSVPV